MREMRLRSGGELFELPDLVLQMTIFVKKSRTLEPAGGANSPGSKPAESGKGKYEGVSIQVWGIPGGR